MKKGISLITLIITIVVVIILAAAVIISLAGNNPINNARIANLISTKDSMESGVLAYTAKIKAKTLGVADTYETITGTNTEDSYRIIEKDDEGLVTCEVTKNEEVITLYKIDKDLFKQNVDKLPSTPNNKCEWYLDEDGNVFLVFEENGLAPKWMTNKENRIDDATLLTFVVYKGGEIGEGVNSSKVETPKEKEWYEKIEEADADWFTYSNNSDGTVTITGFSSAYPGTPTDIKFPTKNKEGKNITGINDKAFRNNKVITKIYIAEGIKSVGTQAFQYCDNLTEVYLPSTLNLMTNSEASNIGVFYGDSNITKVTVPQYVVGNLSTSSVFVSSREKIEEVKFSDTITSIVNNSFYGFKALSKIKIPDTVESIGNSAFYNCISLPNIAIPDTTTTIGNSAFEKCSKAGSLKLGKNLKTIGSKAFYGCSLIPKAIIPEGVTSIGTQAFQYCSNLTEVYLPSTLNLMTNSEASNIGVFYGDSNITKVTVPQYVVGNLSTSSIFVSSRGKIEEVKFSDTITSIVNNSFYGFTALSKITIPDTVESIGNLAFYNCISLPNIVIPDTTTTIGNSAFEKCSKAGSLKLGKNLKTIGSKAFYGCSLIPNAIVPEGVTSIGNQAFQYCSNLTEVYLPSTLNSMTNSEASNIGVFYGDSNIIKVTVPQYVVGNLSTSSVFVSSRDKIEEVKFSDTITSIVNNSFYGFKALSKITLPNTVESIGNSAFYNCYALPKIVIPDKTTVVGNMAFENCSNATGIEFGSSLITIGDRAFRSCKSIENAIMPEGLTKIGTQAFQYCTKLTNVTIPSTVTEMTTSTASNIAIFYGCNIANYVDNRAK